MVFEYRSLDFLSREGGSFLILRDSYNIRSFKIKSSPTMAKIKFLFEALILKISLIIMKLTTKAPNHCQGHQF